MRVMTSDQILIHCLPDSARCKLKGISPLELDSCPACKSDLYGDVCMPDICDDYTEEDNQNKEKNK